MCFIMLKKIEAIAPSIMPISIDLHIKCPFAKKQEKKLTIFYLVKFSHGI